MNLPDPRTSEQLWHARIDEPLDLEPVALEDPIIRAVAALFEELPSSGKKWPRDAGQSPTASTVLTSTLH